MRVREFLRVYPVPGFVAITFLWSWSYWLTIGLLIDAAVIGPFHTLPGLWGPLVAGLVIVQSTSGDVRSWLKRLRRGSAQRRWYVIAVGLVIALGLLGEVIKITLADVPMTVNSAVSLLVTVAIALCVGGALEEIGLRGVAHPALRERYGVFTTGAIIGLFWSIWHLPLQLLGVGFTGSFATFAAVGIPISILLGCLYELGGESVLLVMIAHAVYDMPSLVEAGGSVPPTVVLVSKLSVIAVYWLIVGALSLGRRTGTITFRSEEMTAPTPWNT